MVCFWLRAVTVREAKGGVDETASKRERERERHISGALIIAYTILGLRKILKLHTTFVQRQNTNEYVYRRANEIVNAPTEGDGRKIRPLTEVLEQRRLKLLGHVLRRDRQHPMHQAAFKTQSAIPRETEQRRVGRPRQFWTTTNMEKAWNVIKVNDEQLLTCLSISTTEI